MSKIIIKTSIYFTVITITICVVAYVVYNCGKENPEAIDQSLQNSLWIVDGKQDWKTCWTFFTYSFLHADFWHLAPNMMILLPVGVFLEYGHSSYRPAIVYFMGCILGGMLSGIVAPGVFLLGSSGGVYRALKKWCRTYSNYLPRLRQRGHFSTFSGKIEILIFLKYRYFPENVPR